MQNNELLATKRLTKKQLRHNSLDELLERFQATLARKPKYKSMYKSMYKKVDEMLIDLDNEIYGLEELKDILEEVLEKIPA